MRFVRCALLYYVDCIHWNKIANYLQAPTINNYDLFQANTGVLLNKSNFDHLQQFCFILGP